MASLISLETLRRWSRRDIAEDDMFAQLIMAAVSLRVRRIAQHPEWTDEDGEAPAPQEALDMVGVVAARNYINGIAGVYAKSIDVLSQTIIREYALAIQLTPQEQAQMEAYVGNDDGNPPSGLFTIGMTRGIVENPVVCIYDDSGSDWAIPMIDSRVDGYAAPL